MSDDEIANRIQAECMTGDYEGDHDTADQILFELIRHLGYTKTAEAWDAVGKWYA